MVIYFAHGSWRDTDKDEQRREETFAWLCDAIDQVLYARGCERVSQNEWCSEGLDLLFSCSPRA